MGLFRRSSPEGSSSPAGRRAADSRDPVGQTSDGASPSGVWGAQAGIWSDSLGRLATRCLQLALVVAVVAAVIFGLVQVSLVVIPVVLALIFASAMYPLLELMRRRGVPSVIATVIALVAIVVVLGLIVFFVVVTVKNQLGALTSQALRGLDELQAYVKDGPFHVSDGQIQNAVDAFVRFLQSSTFSSGALAGLSAVTSFVTGLALFVVVLFFFMKDGPTIWAFLLRPFTGAQFERASRVGEKTVSTFGGYVRGTAMVALVDSVGIGLGLFILHVPLALPLSAIVFLASFVPLVGATVAGILAALVALVANGPVAAVVVIAIVIAVNQLEGNFLQPVVMARSLKLHPLVVLLALTAGTLLGGIVGAILSVPIAAVAWGIVTVWNGPDRPAEFARQKRPLPDGR